MDPYLPLERSLLRAEYRNTTSLPIETQLLLDKTLYPYYSPFYQSPYYGPPSLPYWRGCGPYPFGYGCYPYRPYFYNRW